MNTNFLKITCVLFCIMLVVSCNNNAKSLVDTPALKDTTGRDTVKNNTMIVEEDSDYTKRKINLSQPEWRAFKSTFHLNNTANGDGDTISGDFNGDGKIESIGIIAPVADTINKDAFQECIGGCNSYLVSSDTTLLILKVHSNLGGQIRNIGDMDGDGADELMVYPSWWQSNWNPYRIYSIDIATNQWRYFIEPVSIFANELEKDRAFIKKIKLKGYISAYTSVSDDDDIKSSYKNFKIIK